MIQTKKPPHFEPPSDTISTRQIEFFAFAALALLTVWLLAPRGLSWRPIDGAPRVDFSRLALFGILGLGMFYQIRTRITPFSVAPRTTILVICLVVWQLLSALANNNHSRVVEWWFAYLVQYWLFALSLLPLIGSLRLKPTVFRYFCTLSLVLATWSIVEFAFDGAPSFLHSVRDPALAQFVGEDANPIGARRIRWLPLGPFDTNHLQAMAIILFGAGNLLAEESRKRFLIVMTTIATIFAIVFSQMFVSLIAGAFLVSAAWRWSSGWWRWLPILALTMAIGMLAIAAISPPAHVSPASPPAHVSPASPPADNLFRVILDDHVRRDRPGSFYGRLKNFVDVFSQLNTAHFILFGYGPGTLTDWYRTGQQIRSVSDVGSLFHPAIETGLPADMFFLFMLLASVRQGIRSPDIATRGMTMGLAGYSLIALISADYAVTGAAVLAAGLIESWVRTASLQATTDPDSAPRPVGTTP